MKLQYRLCALIALSLFSIGYFRAYLKALYQQYIGSLPRHIIIFGDESASLASSDKTSFTALLCGDIKAQCEDYAPRTPTATGTIINSLIVDDSGREDLSAQVSVWSKELEAGQGKIGHKDALFLFFFGINDFWKFCTRPEEGASAALMDSLDTMFDKIEEVTRKAAAATILVPKIVDITMFPAWRKFGTPKVRNGRELTKVHAAKKIYNEELDRRIRKWNNGNKGKIIVWDADSWVLKTLRGGTAESKRLRTAMKTGDVDLCKTVGDEGCNPEIRGPDWGTVFGDSGVHALMVADIISTIRESRLSAKRPKSEYQFPQFGES